MLNDLAYDITIDDSRITVSMDRDEIDVDELLKFVDFLRMQSFLRQNNLTEEEIAALADEVDRNAWRSVKRKLVRSGNAGFLPVQELADLDEP